MKIIGLILFVVFLPFYAQKNKKDLLTFEVNKDHKEYLIRVYNKYGDKENIEIELKCYTQIIDYKSNMHNIEILSFKQKLSNLKNFFFGGELVDGLYVINFSYIEKEKKINKKREYIVKNGIIIN